MLQEDIFKQIRAELEDFQNPIKVANGYFFDTKRMINKIILYINSKFEHGDRDTINRKKFFYNIVLFRRDITKRMIDVDVKNFRFYSKNIIKRLISVLFEKKFLNWARENNFGEVLNQMAEQVATFGTTVIKITDNLIPSVVDLRKIAFEPSAESLQKSTYIIEEHLLTPEEFLQKRDIWKGVDDVYEIWKNSGEKYIKIYERQGIVPERWVKKGGKENNLVKSLFFVYGVDDYVKTRTGIKENGIVLFKSPLTQYQYFDFSIRKVPGRLLGIGDIELLLDAQIRRNQIANQKASAMEISSKHLFMTPDSDVLSGTNFLTDYLDGTIIQGQLMPVATENRDLSSWASEESVWDTLADRLTFSYDVIRGESIPATTPATNALIQERQASGSFAIMRQNFALFLERITREYILPRLKKQFNNEDFVNVVADFVEDVEKIDELLIDEIVQYYVIKYVEQTGFYPSNVEEFRTTIEKEIKKGGLNRAIKYKKNLFKDVDLDIIVNVSNESVDPATEIVNLQNFMAQIANPSVLQDPLMRKFMLKIAEKMGILITDIQNIEEKKVSTQANQANAAQILGGLENVGGNIPQ